jgi:hypothetical protein
LEHEGDVVVNLPAYQAPRYPQLVEGLIVADSAQEGDRSYMVVQDKESGLDYYRIKVPLWEDQQIEAPYHPYYSPGQLYFPAYHDSRVLLALYFDRAEISQFLDWGANVRMPLESQGNHLLFGKNATSETTMRHYYLDGRPVLTLGRYQSGDTELLELRDGSIVLQTKEEPSADSGALSVSDKGSPKK